MKISGMRAKSGMQVSLTCRFGEDSVERMIRYLVEYMEENQGEKAPYVLDLGTGNGHLLFSLLEAQEEDLPEGMVDPTKLCGIDYSPASIALSRSIGSKRANGCEHVRFDVVDLRDAQQVDQLTKKANDGLGWDIVCDKGTVRSMARMTVRRGTTYTLTFRLLYLRSQWMANYLSNTT